MKKQRREVESEERRYNCAKVSRKKIHRREMLGKSRNAVFFNDLWVGWVETIKAAGAEVAVERRNEKLHAAVARSTFSSQNVQNMSGSEHFLKLRC